jgi:hypothetical protein
VKDLKRARKAIEEHMDSSTRYVEKQMN